MDLEIETIKDGDGITKPKKGKMVIIHYIGFFESGIRFDSSRVRNRPFRFTVGLGKVIKAWDEAIINMSKGERIKLKCPPEYGYGSKGQPGLIPANSHLIFDIELIEVEE